MMRIPFAALLLAGVALAACSRKDAASKFAQRNTPSASEDAASGDPCSLLDTTEVAAAIGPLAGPPYHGTFEPAEGSSSCRYDTKDHRRVLIDVDWSGGAQVMNMVHFGRKLTDKGTQGKFEKGVTVLKSGDTLVGDWDEVAQAAVVCCTLDALRGDQHVQFEWTGTRLTPVTAGALLNSAVKRLDKRLAIDGNAGIASAEQRFAADAKDSLVDACSLVSQKDAEAILGGPLVAPPDHGQSKGVRSCDYRLVMPGGEGRLQLVFTIELREWHDAHASFTQDQATMNMAAGAMRTRITGDTSGVVDSSGPGVPGPWDELGYSAAGYEAVKDNVMLRAASNGGKTKTLALLAKAISGLPKTGT